MTLVFDVTFIVKEIIRNIFCKKKTAHRVRMMVQDSQDPANRQEVVCRGTSIGLKWKSLQ